MHYVSSTYPPPPSPHFQLGRQVDPLSSLTPSPLPCPPFLPCAPCLPCAPLPSTVPPDLASLSSSPSICLPEFSKILIVRGLLFPCPPPPLFSLLSSLLALPPVFAFDCLPGFAGTADGNRSTAQLELPIGLAGSSSTGSSSTLYLLDNNRGRASRTSRSRSRTARRECERGSRVQEEETRRREWGKGSGREKRRISPQVTSPLPDSSHGQRHHWGGSNAGWIRSQRLCGR